MEAIDWQCANNEMVAKNGNGVKLIITKNQLIRNKLGSIGLGFSPFKALGNQLALAETFLYLFSSS